MTPDGDAVGRAGPRPMRIGRPPLKRQAAAGWLANQPWFAAWTLVPTYRGERRAWRQIADAVRDAGFFSANTGTIDVPVAKIVTEAMALRDVRVRREASA